MTVLDTFYLLFKTDAKGAQSDVAALDKQIGELAAKGDKRSDAEIKHLKELRKQRAEMTRDLKDQTQAVDKLGQSFVKTIEGAASAGTALFAFGALKAGVRHATDFNSQLLITSKILGQNATSLSAFANAAEAAGGSKEGAISQYQSLFQFYSARGLKSPTPEKLIDALRRDLATRKTPEAKSQLLQQIGISEQGIVNEGLASPEVFAGYQRQGRATALDAGQIEKLRELKQAEVEAGQEIVHWFGVLGAELADPIIPALKKFGGILHAITNVPGGSTALGAGAAAGGLVGGGFLAKQGLKFLGLGGAAGAAEGAAGLGLGGGPAGVLWAAIAAGSFYGARALTTSYLDGNKRVGDRSALEFWMSQGYTRAQAAGIAGNEYAESSGNPGARNYLKGTHYGLYQWDESRRAKIKAALGIDVATASAADQRRAAAWELQQRGDDARIRATSTSAESAAAFNRYFEVSGESPARRARLAAMIESGRLPGGAGGYGSSPGGGRTLNVKIGDVTVNTQATDAHGVASGIGSALQSQIRYAIVGADDGWKL